MNRGEVAGERPALFAVTGGTGVQQVGTTCSAEDSWGPALGKYRCQCGEAEVEPVAAEKEI